MDSGTLKLLNKYVIASHDIVFFYHHLEPIPGQGLTPYKSVRGRHRRGLGWLRIRTRESFRWGCFRRRRDFNRFSAWGGLDLMRGALPRLDKSTLALFKPQRLGRFPMSTILDTTFLFLEKLAGTSFNVLGIFRWVWRGVASSVWMTSLPLASSFSLFLMSRKPKESTHDALLIEQKLNC